jgi:hypothetical protein
MKKFYLLPLALNGVIYGIAWVGILNFGAIKEKTRNTMFSLQRHFATEQKTTVTNIINKGPISDSLATEHNKKLVQWYAKNVKL